MCLWKQWKRVDLAAANYGRWTSRYMKSLTDGADIWKCPECSNKALGIRYWREKGVVSLLVMWRFVNLSEPPYANPHVGGASGRG
jgi:hypothetical protein